MDVEKERGPKLLTHEEGVQDERRGDLPETYNGGWQWGMYFKPRVCKRKMMIEMKMNGLVDDLGGRVVRKNTGRHRVKRGRERF